VAYFSTPIIADASTSPYYIRPENTLIDVFASRWDTGFYLSIAQEGYQYQGSRLPSVAFFPLMPMLTRAAGTFTGDSLLAGVLVANLPLLTAVMLLHRLVAEEFDQGTADRSVWYLLIYPASFFGSSIYTESLFLLTSIAALWLARKGRWWAAGLVGILAALTRFVGILVAPMLVIEWLHKRWLQTNGTRTGNEPARSNWVGLAAAGLVPIGTVAYMLYLRWTFGDALAFMRASEAWGRAPGSPLAILAGLLVRPEAGWGSALAAGALPLDNWLDLFFVLFFIVCGIVLLAQRRWSEGVFVLLGAVVAISSGLLMSQRRYMWILFPVFMLLARWGKNSWVDRIIFVFSLLALGLFMAMFANWYWVG
jgi:Gpi18-like mannosyltransferase